MRIKKLVVASTLVLLVIIVTISCTSTQKCAAYGERQRYQMERH